MSVDDGNLGQKEKKKTVSVDDGSLGRDKKKEKPLSVDDGSLGREKKKEKPLSVDDDSLGRKKEVLFVEISKPRFRDLDKRTNRRTDKCINIVD